MRTEIYEYISPSQGKYVTEAVNAYSEDGSRVTGKYWYIKGIIMQGGIKNANQRVYPVHEISRAVKVLSDQIKGDYSVIGELDHPASLNINLDRGSHVITDVWMEGANGYGKLKILPFGLGLIVQGYLEHGVKLGVSTRGQGNVKEDGSGEVSDFEIVTVDIVANPSAPGAYPTPIYEQLMNTKGGNQLINMSKELYEDKKAQQYIKQGLVNFISKL